MGVLVPMVAVDGFALEGRAKKEGPLSLPIGAPIWLVVVVATYDPVEWNWRIGSRQGLIGRLG